MPNTYFQQANQLVEEEKFEQAIELYKQAIAHNPNFHLYYFKLGELFSKLGKLEQALESYKKAIELRPSAALYYFYSAQILEKQNQKKEAIFYYKKAIEINPDLKERCTEIVKNYFDNEVKHEQKVTDYSLAYAQLGDIFWENNELDRAKDYYKELISINANIHNIIYNNFAQVLIQISEGNNNNSPDNLSISNDCNLLAAALRSRVSATSGDRKFEQINLKNYQNLIKTKPNSENCLHIADLLLEQGRINSAIAIYKMVLKFYPDSNASAKAYEKLNKIFSVNCSQTVDSVNK